DLLRAWKGPHPVIPKADVTVEIGSWRGRITSAKFIYPWTRERGATLNSAISEVRRALLPFALCGGLLFAVLLAHRNWKLGRGDHRGALQIAALQFVLSLVIWTGTVHAVPRNVTLDLLFNAGADA